MFFKFKKTPYEIIKSIKDSLNKLESCSDNKKTKEECLKGINNLKHLLLSTQDQTTNNNTNLNNLNVDSSLSQPELIAQLSTEMYNNDILLRLVKDLMLLDFETRKSVVQIFGVLLKRKIGQRLPTVEYIKNNNYIIVYTLFKGYENYEIALNTGIMLRECIKHEQLAEYIMNNSNNMFYRFFKYLAIDKFDIASDCFQSFRDILIRHKQLTKNYLENNYDKFFGYYDERLLKSNNYVLMRQSLKLLNEILLDRTNFNVMTKYISYSDNLKLMMNLLKNKSRNIQFEAFHVFKVFVANPNKSESVLNILKKNKDKMLTFLNDFHNDRTDDQQFIDEKAFLIKQIQKL